MPSRSHSSTNWPSVCVVDDALDGLVDPLADLRRRCRRPRARRALAVDDLALLVQHVVVLEDVLADLEVVLLDPLLGALDLPRQHLRARSARPPAARSDRGSCRSARRRTGARADPRPRGRSASRPGRPGGRSGRAAGCRCGATRGARCRARRGRRASGTPSPSLMSTPRPAMFVAIVTRPRWPASLMISASRSCCFAFSTVVRDAALREQAGELLGLLDGDRADQHRLALLVALGDVVDDGGELLVLRLEDEVVLVARATIGTLVGIGTDVELVDLGELVRLGRRRAGHAGELLVEAEVVLDRDRRDGHVLRLDLHALLRLDRLVQALAPAPALHDAAGELVDDLDLALD